MSFLVSVKGVGEEKDRRKEGSGYIMVCGLEDEEKRKRGEEKEVDLKVEAEVKVANNKERKRKTGNSKGEKKKGGKRGRPGGGDVCWLLWTSE